MVSASAAAARFRRIADMIETLQDGLHRVKICKINLDDPEIETNSGRSPHEVIGEIKDIFEFLEGEVDTSNKTYKFIEGFKSDLDENIFSIDSYLDELERDLEVMLESCSENEEEINTFDYILNYSCDNKNIKKKYLTISSGSSQASSLIVEQITYNSGNCYGGTILIELIERECRVSYTDNIRYNDKCSTMMTPMTCIFVNIELKTSSDESLHGLHATYLLLDNEKKTIEYFDPAGGKCVQDVENFLFQELKQYYPDYEYIGLFTYCPIVGPQDIIRKGWCYAIGLFYIYTRFMTPNTTREMIIKQLLVMDRNMLIKLISNFICYLYDIYTSIESVS